MSVIKKGEIVYIVFPESSVRTGFPSKEGTVFVDLEDAVASMRRGSLLYTTELLKRQVAQRPEESFGLVERYDND